MSDQTKKPGEGDFDIDWDDALAEWEEDLASEGSVRPVSAPMPQTSKGGPELPKEPPKEKDKARPPRATPARPFYRPPLDLLEKAAQAKAPPKAPDKPRARVPSKPLLDFPDDFEEGRTRIAAVPDDLDLAVDIELPDDLGAAAAPKAEEVVETLTASLAETPANETPTVMPPAGDYALEELLKKLDDGLQAPPTPRSELADISDPFEEPVPARPARPAVLPKPAPPIPKLDDPAIDEPPEVEKAENDPAAPAVAKPALPKPPLPSPGAIGAPRPPVPPLPGVRPPPPIPIPTPGGGPSRPVPPPPPSALKTRAPVLPGRPGAPVPPPPPPGRPSLPGKPGGLPGPRPSFAGAPPAPAAAKPGGGVPAITKPPAAPAEAKSTGGAAKVDPEATAPIGFDPRAAMALRGGTAPAAPSPPRAPDADAARGEAVEEPPDPFESAETRISKPPPLPAQRSSGAPPLPSKRSSGPPPLPSQRGDAASDRPAPAAAAAPPAEDVDAAIAETDAELGFFDPFLAGDAEAAGAPPPAPASTPAAALDDEAFDPFADEAGGDGAAVAAPPKHAARGATLDDLDAEIETRRASSRPPRPADAVSRPPLPPALPGSPLAKAFEDEDDLAFDAQDEVTTIALSSDELDAAEVADVEAFDEDELAEIERAEAEADARAAAEARARASAAPADDQGAAAARRTVRYRKARTEHFPLVGRDEDALKARRTLMTHLVAKAKGAARARLECAIAEMDAQLGEHEAAIARYRSAHEADPKDVVALRALRHDAAERGAWDEVAKLLAAEASLDISAADRSLAGTLLAEVQLHKLGDAAAAEKSARLAAQQRPQSVVASMLVAEACLVQGRDVEAMMALEKAADAWNDPRARAALLVEVARSAERAGNGARAKAVYARAAEADPTAIDAALGLARASRTTGETDAAIDALVGASRTFHGPFLPESVLRIAARLAHHAAKRPADAVKLLAESRGVLALRTRAEAARAAGDTEAYRQAVEMWAAASGGTERALALVTLAEIRAEAGDLDAADAALRDASLADGRLGLVRVVREVLARKAGDASRLARAIDATAEGPGSALVAAAKIARDKSAAGDERELLERALDEGEAAATADVVALDAAAAEHDAGAIRAALRREADRRASDQKTGPLLALADAAVRADALEAAENVLQEAGELSPGDPLVLRALARVIASEKPDRAAALWLEEAASADPPRAAFAATFAARLLRDADADPSPALRRALDALPAYAPAAWALEPLARAAADVSTLVDLNDRLAEVAPDPVEAAGRLVRAALLRAGEDPQAAAALLERARTARPDDVIIHELMLRLGEGASPAERAQLLEKIATGSPPELGRAAWLRAAAAWEDADDLGRAVDIYRRVFADHPKDVVATIALDRLEATLGDLSRIAERRAEAVKSAESDEARAAALDSLADLDLHDRKDTDAAAHSLRSILEIAKGHVPSLRALERIHMQQGRDDALLEIERELAEHLGSGPDASAHARLAARILLRPEDAEGQAADALFASVARRVAPDEWLALRAGAAAAAIGDFGLLARTAEVLAALSPSEIERATHLVHEAEALERAGNGDEAIARLETAVQIAHTHPTAAEELGRLSEERGDHAHAAEAYEAAARTADVPQRAAALWHAAGVLWQDRVGDVERATAALSTAAEIDVGFRDVFDRLQRIYTEQDDADALDRLMGQRLAAGGDSASLVALHLHRASLCEQSGDTQGAKTALRSALALEPERVEALRKLGDLSFADEDWRGAAEALIKIARLRKDREELREVFFKLGEIYDRHMPDPKRAEAAFRRVTKLAPDDVDALARLADIYQRANDTAQAVEVLQHLTRVELDPERNRDFRLRLAEVLEQQDVRQAEAVLELTRRNSPTDLVVLRTISDFYQRQSAQPALAMHLNRAVNDFRHALETDPTDTDAWPGLVQVLDWRGRSDAARCVASAAAAIGVIDVELARRLDPQGGVPGAGADANRAELDDLLAPEGLTPATRAVFRLAFEVLDKVVPFDSKALRPEKLGRDHPLRAMANEIGRWFGVGDVQILTTSVAPRVCVPIEDSPVTILLGRELVAVPDERQRMFLLARAVRIARDRMSVAVRSQPAQLATAMAGLVRTYDPHFVPRGLEAAAVDDAARRVAKAIPRKLKDELAPIVVEMGGSPSFDAASLGRLAAELGDRAALLAVGSVPAAFAAVLLLASEEAALRDSTTRAEAVRRLPEPRALLAFATSDALFDARERLGLDRR